MIRVVYETNRLNKYILDENTIKKIKWRLDLECDLNWWSTRPQEPVCDSEVLVNLDRFSFKKELDKHKATNMIPNE